MIPDSMIRALKGPALAILLLMMNHRQEVLSAEFIERNTGYGDEAVQRGLLLLRDYRLVNRINRYTWQLAGIHQQLPLGEYSLDAEIDSGKTGVPQSQTTDSEPGTEASSVEDFPELVIDSGFSGVSQQKTAGTPEKPESHDPSSSGYLNSDSMDSNLQPARTARSQKTRANFAALDQAGVREPARSRLAALEHVTAESVEYHCATADSLGQAIYRIEHGWPIKRREAHEAADRHRRDAAWLNAREETDEQYEA